jgi:hypothetical protein
MMKQPQILRPIKVGLVYPVISKSPKWERLLGCKLTVTYDGIALDKKRLQDMGLFTAGYGSRYISVDSGGKPSQTVIEYFFRNGWLYPEPFECAEKFRDAVSKGISDFIPTDVSGIGKNHRGLYKLDISYPIAAQNNMLFNQFVHRGKPKIDKILSEDGKVKVVYVFGKGNIAYSEAMNFKQCICIVMENAQREK